MEQQNSAPPPDKMSISNNTSTEPMQFPQGNSVVVQQINMPPQQTAVHVSKTGMVQGSSHQQLSSEQFSLSSTAGAVAQLEQFNPVSKTGGSVFVSVPVSTIPPVPPAQTVPDINSKLDTFWQEQQASVQNIPEEHWKNPEFPLARIKKIMRMDEDVRMISAEVPIMLSKAVEIFIAELSMRAWQHTEESKRRTIQRSDIAMAITKNDMFDFLIDIVPREEIQGKPKTAKSLEGSGENLQLLPPDVLQMYIQHLTTVGAGEEDGTGNVLQNQLQVLQQLLHIQQLQEQQESSSATSTGQQVGPLSTTSGSAGAVLDTQVLQTSDTQNLNSDVLEQLRTQSLTSTEYPLLQRINPTELLDTTVQHPIVAHTQPSMLTAGAQLQVEPTASSISIPQLDSLTHQVLQSVEPMTCSEGFSATTGSAVVQLPTEFGTGSESVSSAMPTTQSGSSLVAFRSTPLRLTHVHGGSSLVELSDVTSTTT